MELLEPEAALRRQMLYPTELRALRLVILLDSIQFARDFRLLSGIEILGTLGTLFAGSEKP